MKKVLYSIIRTYNLLLVIIPAIAYYRATIQPEYKWGLLVIHGKGTSDEYWILVVAMFCAWVTFILDSWYKRKWYYVLPITLFSIVAFILVYGYFTQREMNFQGDVWKFKFEIGLLIVVLSILLLIGSIVWAVLDLKDFKSSNLKATLIQKKKVGNCFVFEWNYYFAIWAG